MGTSRARLYHSTKDGKWIWTTEGGVVKAELTDAGAFKIGANGTGVTEIFAFVGTSAAIAAVGSYQVEIGSIPVTGARVNDIIIASPQSALPTEIAIGAFRVSGSNNVNFYAANTDIAAIASMPVMPWSVAVMRKG